MKEPDHLIAKILSGEGSPEEKQSLKRWLEESPANSSYFREFEQIWQSAQIKVEQFEPDAKVALQKLDSLILDKERKEKKARIHFYQYLKIAAAILLIAISVSVALIYGFDTYKSEERNLTTITAATESGKSVILEDGTIVWLNSNSSLRYPNQFTGNKREVFLVGEAFFEVKKDSQKPFLIHAGNSVTQVLGTAFNVNAFPEKEEVIVSVISGKVAFYPQEEEENQVVLEKGERGIFTTQSEKPVKSLLPNLNFLSWKTGVLTFDNTALQDAIQTIAHHFKRKIILDERLSDCRLSATFNNQPIEDILDELALILHLQINQQDNKIILRGKGC